MEESSSGAGTGSVSSALQFKLVQSGTSPFSFISAETGVRVCSELVMCKKETVSTICRKTRTSDVLSRLNNCNWFMLMQQSSVDSFPEMNSLLIRDLSLSWMTQTQPANHVF